MRILHTSDLHGEWARKEFRENVQKSLNEFDVWVDTGDFFPNITRGAVRVEVPQQHSWVKSYQVCESILSFLDGRPMISVPGNHDYISLAEKLKEAGGSAYEITPSGVEVLGLIWAGFREIPWIIGEWNGETNSPELQVIVDKVWETNPDILVTHSPPGGILDNRRGVNSLGTALRYKENKIRAHLFGHIHELGGQEEKILDCTFYNGARGAHIITLGE